MKKIHLYLPALLLGMAVAFTSCGDEDEPINPNQPEQPSTGGNDEQPEQPEQPTPDEPTPDEPTPDEPSDNLTVSGTINGHDYVDLGLSSGLKWATCNVGADKPEENGDYYAWGEVETKESYSDANCPWYGVNYTELMNQGVIDENRNLTEAYDAARKNWGGKWRMPTTAEQQELRDKCNWEWTTLHGTNGCLVTSKTNGNTLFLPATGMHYGNGFSNVSVSGHYWSATARDHIRDAYRMYFSSDTPGCDTYSRSYGFSIRPVAE